MSDITDEQLQQWAKVPDPFYFSYKRELATELLAARKELAANQFEWCHECNSPMSNCGPESPDGEPTLDCQVCILRARIAELEADRESCISFLKEGLKAVLIRHEQIAEFLGKNEK